MELVSISFCLALAGVVYAGDASTLEIRDFIDIPVGDIESWGSWFFFFVNLPSGSNSFSLRVQQFAAKVPYRKFPLKMLPRGS